MRVALNPNGQITLMEAVPVRLGPNLQEYFTETGIEGVLVPAIHAVAEVLAVAEVIGACTSGLVNVYGC